jgi:hypothetical protein
MSTDLVQAIMSSLTSEAIAKIAALPGLDAQAAQKAIGAAIPGILAGLAGASSTIEGARRVGTEVSRAEAIPSASSVNETCEADLWALANEGAFTLSFLIGGATLDALSRAVSGFGGIGQGAAKGLLGLLTPQVLAILRREQLSSGFDSRGLAVFLAGQRQNVASAMPAAVARIYDMEAGQPGPSAFAGPRGSSAGEWLYWLVPAIALAFAAVYFLPGEQTAPSFPGAVKSTLASREPAALPPAEYGAAPLPALSATAASDSIGSLENDIITNIAKLRASLQGIKDPASARTSLGELKGISARFTKLKAAAQQLSPKARKALATAVAAKVPDLNVLLDKIASQATLNTEAKPAMDTLKLELVSLSKA